MLAPRQSKEICALLRDLAAGGSPSARSAVLAVTCSRVPLTPTVERPVTLKRLVLSAVPSFASSGCRPVCEVFVRGEKVHSTGVLRKFTSGADSKVTIPLGDVEVSGDVRVICP